MSSTRRPDRRYAHPPGATFTAYSPDGRYIITAGTNNAVRKYTVASEDEPETIDDCQESNTGLAVANDKFIIGSEDGTVSLFNMSSNELDQILVRCSLPVRDVALSPDGNWAAVASDETAVKVVNTNDNVQIMYLREQSRSVKHVTFHPTGAYLAASGTDGVIYIYSISSQQPSLIKKVEGVVRALEPDDDATSKAAWSPDGRAFAVVTPTKDIVVISRSTWERQRTFSTGHTGHINDIAWSPNGAFLASAGADGKLVIWESKTQTIIKKYDQPKVKSISWHPKENTLSLTNNDGELVTLPNVLPPDQEGLLLRPPLLNDTSDAGTTDKPTPRQRRDRSLSRDPLDELMGLDDDDDFIIDDDGMGYAEPKSNNVNKRGFEYIHDDGYNPSTKRRAYDAWEPTTHAPFQPGSTPWRGGRKYLALNLIGFVWTVDQETHNTVTVEFYDRDLYRDFHFTDPYLYDKACLNENGALFSSPKTDSKPAYLFYRPHSTWSTRADWRIQMPEGEDITAISLSNSYIIALTSKSYLRVYTLFGTPLRIHRHPHSPVVTCASWRDYVMVLSNGPVAATGHTTLTYSIMNIKHDETLQADAIIALPPNGVLKSIFFSEEGNPVIYDSEGVLLVLQHWRSPGQANWVPVLDTTQIDSKTTNTKTVEYWPVAVAHDKFHCIVLRPAEKYPYFPRPLLSEFDFKIPLSSSTSTSTQSAPHEETLVRESLLLSLLEDLIGARPSTSEEGHARSTREHAIDRAILQMLAVECRDDKGEKALELCRLFRDRDKGLELAGRIAVKYGRGVLAGKIAALGEEEEMEFL
ncbi:WD40 repeat-like protein [Terfezia boudieri ATCC MYA-4762]|uniref:WD40 repeat-like protein n=1 Tax=Terfezia boudieri ATCC MYA-4762 TaxID=1051890 RepID=A0A3N4LXL2_9PEZI|nr:WD40 repeat-like protein [Terfezia boudieri ATCC MYA-4762]